MKTSKNQKKQITKILGIGKIDFNFYLELTDQDEIDLGVSADSIDSLEKLKFITDRPEYLDKINLNSNSPLISTFLFINKVSKHKTFIEFASLAKISYSDEELFLKPIITHVTEHNFMFLNENDLLPFYKTVINFSIKKGMNVLHTFNLSQNDNVNSSVNKSERMNTNNEEDTMFDKLDCDYNQFNYLFIDLNEFVDMTHFNIGFSDVLNLISSIDKYNKDVSFCVFYPNIISNINMLNIESLNNLSEILNYADFVFSDKREAIAYYNLQSQLDTTNTTNYHSSSSGMNHIGGKSKYQFKNLVERSFLMGSFRRKSYCRNSKCDKVGFFFDDLNSIHILESHRDNYEKSVSNEYKLNIIPKCNNANKKLVEEFKRQYDLNKNFLNSVYLGGFLSKYFNNGGYEYSFYVASEITKRVLEIFKLGLELPVDNEFYHVSSKKSNLLNNYEKKSKQEKGFVLDCTNLINSKLNEYNPLFDNNLTSFFHSNVVRRHLNDMGFINTKGFILLDTKHKNKQTLLLEKSAEKVLKRDKNVMIAVKENACKMNQENLEKVLHNKSKILNDPSIGQLEMLAHTLNYSPVKNKQLPSYSESYYKGSFFGKTKLQPLNYNKTSVNMSFKQEGKLFYFIKNFHYFLAI